MFCFLIDAEGHGSYDRHTDQRRTDASPEGAHTLAAVCIEGSVIESSAVDLHAAFDKVERICEESGENTRTACRDLGSIALGEDCSNILVRI